MPGLDTNLLVRWLAADDEAQTRHVRTVFETAARQQASLWIPTTVALEIEWVLRSRHRLAKASVLEAFTALLERQEVAFEAEEALERALHAYRLSGADFADCLHAGLCAAAGYAPLLTFDEKAARLSGVEPIAA